MIMKRIMYLTLLLGLTTNTYAASSEYHSSLQKKAILSGFYIGGGVGESDYWDGLFNTDSDSINTSITSLESNHSTLKIYSGYHINRIVGVEVGYTRYGDLTSKSDNAGKLSPTAISVVANVGYTFSTGLRAFGIAGLSALDLKQTDNWFESDTQVAFRYGFGGEYQPSNATGLTFRLAYEADIYAVKASDFYSSGSNSERTYVSNLGSLYLGAAYKF